MLDFVFLYFWDFFAFSLIKVTLWRLLWAFFHFNVVVGKNFRCNRICSILFRLIKLLFEFRGQLSRDNNRLFVEPLYLILVQCVFQKWTYWSLVWVFIRFYLIIIIILDHHFVDRTIHLAFYLSLLLGQIRIVECFRHWVLRVDLDASFL